MGSRTREIFSGVKLPQEWGLERIESGKVRERSIDEAQELIVLITSNDISAFDWVHPQSIPGKGQVLTRLSKYWFEATRHIVNNHMEAVPDPNVMIAKKVRPLPVEVIVRGFMTGVTSTSIWTMYQHGERNMYGQDFRDGYKKNDQLDHPVITPTTKAERGAHDGPLDDAEVLEILDHQGFDPAIWATVKEKAFALFAFAQERARAAGYLLVDTKIEFGIDKDGEPVVIDELFTPDSSRYWELATYQQLISQGAEPENFDKEYMRLALKKMGFSGDGPFPPLSDELVAEISRRYRVLYEAITGEQLIEEAEASIQTRIEHNLLRYWSERIKPRRQAQ